MIKVTTAIIFYLSLVYFQYTFQSLLPNELLGKIMPQLDDIFLILIFITLLITRQAKNSLLFPVKLFLISFSLIFLVSALANQTPLLNILLSFKGYIYPFLFYYIIMNSNINFHAIYKALIILFSFEFIIQLFQFFLAFKGGYLNDDVATGTFPGANNLSYVYAMLSFFAFGNWLDNRRKKIFWVMLLFFSGTAISFGTYGLLALPLLIVLFYHKKLFFSKNSYVYLFFITILILPLVLGLSINDQDKRSVKYGLFSLYSPEFLYDKFTVSEYNVYSGSARMLWFSITQDRINQYAAHSLIGMGPGVYASNAAFQVMTTQNESIYNIFNQEEIGVDVFVDSQIIPLWGELGYIGITFYVLFFIWATLYGIKIQKKSIYSITKLLGTTSAGLSLFMLIGMYVNHFIEIQVIMLTSLFFLAFAHKLYRNESL